jgi:hypothetical protein
MATAEQDVSATFATSVRIGRVGVTMEVAVGGLTGCAGQPAQLGIYSATGSPAMVAGVRVDGDGGARAAVIPSEAALDFYPGVSADCLGTIPILAEVPIPVIDPPQPAAGDPAATPFPGNEGVSFQWEGRTTVGEPVVLSVDGLREQCNGQVVQLGFFAGLFGPELSRPTVVDDSGHAMVEVTANEPTGDQRAGVVGDCVAQGFAVSYRSFGADQPLPDDEIGHSPTPVTPQAPVVGSGTQQHAPLLPGSWLVWAGAVAVLLATGLLALAFRRRLSQQAP